MIVDVDLDAPVRDIEDATGRYGRALLIARREHRPVGRLEVTLRDGVLAVERYERDLREASVDDARPTVGGRLPSVTVAVCTRDRADSVIETIASFEALEYDGEVEIVVVDNAPRDDALARALDGRAQHAGVPWRRVVEPVPGLSQARNRALSEARGEIVAFTDDDAVVERRWLQAIAAGFATAGDVACVTGLTLPAELETRAQEWYERYGGFNKGRGFRRAVFRAGELGRQHPLYPFPAFGAGVNMAFRTRVLRELGGFELALGPGRGKGGGEDTAMLAEILMGGWAIAYEPAAVVRHLHRRDEDVLHRQLRGYGIGLTAYLTWCVHRHPRESLGLARMTVPAIRYLLSRGATHDGGEPPGYPSSLSTALRRGLPRGPWAYARAALATRRT